MRGKPPEVTAPAAEERLIPAHAGKTRDQDRTQRTGEAHPRSCGENVTIPVGIVYWGGSSPLMRGKREQVPGPKLREGLIPAHAGKTRGCARTPARWRAHPRSCGENKTLAHIPSGNGGSSPLMRGKPAHGRPDDLRRRLIPAHAGKTPDGSRSACMARAHPRSCGENLGLTHARVEVEGSSPLMRGKRRRSACPGRSQRLIPAHAGKTVRGHGRLRR